jgi:hypothetical protein
MKFTLIKELQIEAQTYFNEARRMKKLLDQTRATKKSLMSSSSRGKNAWNGEPGEVAAMQEEVKALRRENVYLRQEREMEDKSYNILQTLRNKLGGLGIDLAGVQEHIQGIEQHRSNGQRLAEVITRDGDEEQRSRPGSGRQSRAQRPQSAARPQSAVRSSRGGSREEERPNSRGGGRRDESYEDEEEAAPVRGGSKEQEVHTPTQYTHTHT